MLRDSRTSLHFGASFVFAPQPLLDTRHRLDFQSSLATHGLEFPQVNASSPKALVLRRDAPPLEIQLRLPGPPVGQLVVLAPHPARTLDDFISEAQDIAEAFSVTWPGELQIVQRDCTIRHLYDAAAEHAFQYLWEQRFHNAGEELSLFGRPIAGGGLRFVMPPADSSPNSANIEVKIESYLHDWRKLYVDVQMTWLGQTAMQAIDPEAMLRECEHFATTEVVAFMEGGERE